MLAACPVELQPEIDTEDGYNTEFSEPVKIVKNPIGKRLATRCLLIEIQEILNAGKNNLSGDSRDEKTGNLRQDNQTLPADHPPHTG